MMYVQQHVDDTLAGTVWYRTGLKGSPNDNCPINNPSINSSVQADPGSGRPGCPHSTFLDRDVERLLVHKVRDGGRIPCSCCCDSHHRLTLHTMGPISYPATMLPRWHSMMVNSPMDLQVEQLTDEVMCDHDLNMVESDMYHEEDNLYEGEIGNLIKWSEQCLNQRQFTKRNHSENLKRLENLLNTCYINIIL